MSPLTTAAAMTWPLGWAVYAGLAARSEFASLGPSVRSDAAASFFFAVAAGLATLVLDASPQRFVRAGACAALCGAAVIDARTGFLPDRLIIPANAVALALAASTGHVDAAAAGICVLAAPMAALLLVSRGRLLGWGDVKTLVLIGATLGPQRGALALAAACAGGASVAFARFAFRRSASRTVPFGPYLTAGFLAALAPDDALLRTAGLIA